MAEPIESHTRPRGDMHSPRNYFLHGLYLTLYGPIKPFGLPFFNYLRFAVLRLFSRGIKTCAISEQVTIWFPWRVKIGKKSSLNQGVIIDGYGQVDIGRGVRIAAYTCINTTDHQYDDPDRPIGEQGFVTGKVVIEDDVWIGAGVQVNKGLRIGRGSVIGSGAVVTKDIPPYSIATGVPCRVIGSRKPE